MDVAKLINMVREREPLWNRQHPQYKDRDLAATLWGQVADRLNVDIETARYKWRGLRDTYRVQLRKHKQPNNKREKQTIYTPKWEYFNEMLFVRDHIHLDVNITKKKIKDKSNGMFEENNYFDGGSEEPSSPYLNFDVLCETEMTEGDPIIVSQLQNNEINDQNGNLSQNIKLKLLPEEVNEDKLHFKKQLESIFANVLSSLEDDNLCFLLSLLPQMKSLPNKRNMYVRLKMQEILLNEIANAHNEK